MLVRMKRIGQVEKTTDVSIEKGTAARNRRAAVPFFAKDCGVNRNSAPATGVLGVTLPQPSLGNFRKGLFVFVICLINLQKRLPDDERQLPSYGIRGSGAPRAVMEPSAVMRKADASGGRSAAPSPPRIKRMVERISEERPTFGSVSGKTRTAPAIPFSVGQPVRGSMM